jgi:hypothetical protein
MFVLSRALNALDSTLNNLGSSVLAKMVSCYYGLDTSITYLSVISQIKITNTITLSYVPTSTQ